ncbi:protein of unknown function [Taphrina deformans PYCC 5710]|uniref:Cytochrome P450 n=1 Tax=Taphrina deformans (strain PYCC 5710 / ATCC 11124 / CBS 356.35 / IMI 108563 / JCM 9778 / NBRC 8474) TaxID=1097556 RepID=R4XJI3_TAPDE|nr:protein of unknown function [Taphrina deformans PYCC 5710]|eukprot:CCG84618.1 protein of unknown function [Taphrina deformans PYCC 5710]
MVTTVFKHEIRKQRRSGHIAAGRTFQTHHLCQKYSLMLLHIKFVRSLQVVSMARMEVDLMAKHALVFVIIATITTVYIYSYIKPKRSKPINIPGTTTLGVDEQRHLERARSKGLEHEALRALHEKYGSILQVRKNELSFNLPCASDEIYRNRRFLKKSMYKPDIESPLFDLRDPVVHAKRRRILMPSFRPRDIDKFEPIVLELLQAWLERLENCSAKSTALDMSTMRHPADHFEDLMKPLIEAYGKGEISLSAVHADAAGLTFAGSDTTAFTITTALSYIINTPNVQNKLYYELSALFDSAENISDHMLRESAPYLNAVVRETLRIWPAVPGPLQRVSNSDEIVCGVKVPAGVTVSSAAFAICRDERYWTEPGSELPLIGEI